MNVHWVFIINLLNGGNQLQTKKGKYNIGQGKHPPPPYKGQQYINELS
jgi:hypothetical protein